MIAFVEVTAEDSSRILSDIRKKDSLTDDREAFVQAIQRQDMWSNREDALAAWKAFINSGKTKLPGEVVNYHIIISGVSAR